jgi:hypothetical protein
LSPFRRDRSPAGSKRLVLGLCVMALASALPESGGAFRVREESGVRARWDAAPRTVGGEERSLDGGLRYSIGGGSYEAFRDRIRWIPQQPSAEEVREAIRRAFDHWTVDDPATGLPAGFRFVEDLETEAVDDPGEPFQQGDSFGLNRGAEIDLFVETPHAGSEYGASVVLSLDPGSRELTLTSGTTGYPGLAIAGVDIRINPRYSWNLAGFELLLTHEIGHALGLTDVDSRASVEGWDSPFLDDDYDPSSPERALATLTNPFAHRIDPLDPDASELKAWHGSMKTDPGLETPGVQLLMESEGILDLLDIQRAGEPILQADEFAARQFLYPVVPSETSIDRRLLFLASGLAGLGAGMALRVAWNHRSRNAGRPGREEHGNEEDRAK